MQLIQMGQLLAYNLEMDQQYSILIQVHHTHIVEHQSLPEPIRSPLSRLTIVERQQRLQQLLLPYTVAAVVEAVETTTVLLEHIEIL